MSPRERNPGEVDGRGILYVVGTPIGNLSDMSPRGVDTLKSVQVVAAEDTRRTRALLTHFGVTGKSVVKLDASAGDRELDRLLVGLTEGQGVALVTDAGTPSVSDPGTALVRAAAAAGIRVVTIPGPSAVTAAVALSGLVEGPFLFLGFLPRKGHKRARALERIVTTEEPIVLFESPQRTQETLHDLAERMPGRLACVARELTKLHEEAIRGPLSDLAAREEPFRGEVTIVLGPAAVVAAVAPDEDVDAAITARLREGATVKDVATELSGVFGLPRRDVYARAVALQAPPRKK